MDAEDKQAFIHRKAREDRGDPEGAQIRWSRHGITEMVKEGWTRVLVEEGLQEGEVIEDYPTCTDHCPTASFWGDWELVRCFTPWWP